MAALRQQLARDLCVLPPLLGERAGVRASVSSNFIFGVGSPLEIRIPNFRNNETPHVGCYKLRKMKSILWLITTATIKTSLREAEIAPRCPHP